MQVGTADENSRPARRRWIRYSLRGFLVVVTLICIGVGWEANRARRQGEAVREVERLGGVIRFDYQFDEKGALLSDADPSAPAWLREALGEEHFRRVVVLDLSYGGPRLDENRITNERLAILGGVPDLRTLELGRELGITDEGLINLRNLRNLKTLYLYNTGVEGAGLSHLRRLEKLEHLNLLGTPLTDEGLRHLDRMPSLRSLNLNGTRISDAGLEPLAGLRSLRDLQLADTDITDAGLEHLESMTGLTSVSLHRTRVTATGVAALQAALPKCNIAPVPEELSRKPVDIALWPEGQRPTAAELMTRAKELGVDLDLRTDKSRPGSPIVSLRLFNSDVSAESVARLLTECPELEVMNLRDLIVGDHLLQKMPALPKLRYLAMTDCQVADPGAASLAKHPRLQEVVLDSNYITDEGLATLENMPALERLSFSNNRVTYKARIELKRARPGLQMPL